jgi:hypothetical protein
MVFEGNFQNTHDDYFKLYLNKGLNNIQTQFTYTVGTFHTKGWTKFFSGQIYTFWGQNNVFYDSARPQVIF